MLNCDEFVHVGVDVHWFIQRILLYNFLENR